MGRLISLLNTIFGTLLSVGAWAGNEGAKSAGCTRLMGFSEGKKKKSSASPFDNPYGGGSLFDNPFDAPKQKDFLQGGSSRPSKVGGHSIGNHGWSGGNDEPIVDYTNLNSKDAYLKSLKAGYEKACKSGIDLPKSYITTKTTSAPKSLSRGQAVPGFGPGYSKHDYSKEAEKAEHLNLRGPSAQQTNKGYQGASNANSGAGNRTGSSPSGPTRGSVRNYIKF